MLTALGGPSRISLLLTGHSHFDHSFDTATWSRLTNAPIIGSKTTCLQAQAAGLPQTRCREVLGGERIDIAAGVWMRGQLRDDHGVLPTENEWHVASVHHWDGGHAEELRPLAGADLLRPFGG